VVTMVDRDETSVMSAPGWRPRASLIDLLLQREPIAAA